MSYAKPSPGRTSTPSTGARKHGLLRMFVTRQGASTPLLMRLFPVLLRVAWERMQSLMESEDLGNQSQRCIENVLRWVASDGRCGLAQANSRQGLPSKLARVECRLIRLRLVLHHPSLHERLTTFACMQEVAFGGLFPLDFLTVQR